MKIKSYFAGSVEQAVHDARQELGGEARLITTRRAAPEARSLGAYEVVFGIAETPAGAAPVEDLNGELAMLREQLDGIKRLLRLGGACARSYARAELDDLYERLRISGFEERWARQITEETGAAWDSLSPEKRLAGNAAWYGCAADCIGKRLRYAPEFTAAPSDSNRTVILVGPPGAGKTTALAKLAIHEALARRLSLRIISVDLHRVASHEKLRSYAAIMGAGFSAASTAPEFMEALGEFRDKNVLLIDTPGYASRDWEWARDLARLLAQLKNTEVHLVLPASMTASGLIKYLQLYEEFKPGFVLVTKLDEAESYGPILSAALELDKPVSYLTAGQSIPEDFEPANSGALLRGLLAPETAETVTAA